MLEALRADLVYAIRTLRRTPLFTAVAIASLALGLGANTAIFTLLDQILLRPLPVKNPRELVLLDSVGPNFGMIAGSYAFSYPMYKDIQERSQVFSNLAGRYGIPLTIQTGRESEKVDGELVTGNFFETLGVKPAIGRLLTPEDDKTPGGHPVVVLGYNFWRRQFGGDPGVLGRTIRVNGSTMSVIGIAEPNFDGVQVGRSPAIYLPVMMKKQATPTWDDLDKRRTMWLQLIGRLKPGAKRDQAAASLQPLYRQIREAELKEIPFANDADFSKRFTSTELALKDGSKGVPELQGEVRTPLWVLMGMVGLVLLVACANVANLLLARAAGRQKEIAVRLALGAGRWDLLRQLMVESLLLSALGGLAGLLVAGWTLDVIMGILPAELGRSTLSTSMDWRVLAFSFALSVLTGILFGLAPAMQSLRPDVAPTLKQQGSNLAGGWGALRSRKVLVVAQVSLSLLLLVGAGLFTQSLANLRRLDPGFRTENLVSFKVDAALAGYSPERTRQIYKSMLDRIESIPGVKSASLAENTLLGGDYMMITVKVQGYDAKQSENLNPQVNGVGPGFFAAMGIPLIAGREIRPDDVFGGPKVAVVNQSFARYFFKDDNPIGRRFRFGRGDTYDIEIVGVVRDGKYNSLRDQPIRYVYVPLMQSEAPGQVTFYVRTMQEQPMILGTVRKEAASLAPGIALFSPKSVKVQVDESLAQERLVAFLCAMFGAMATLLAAIGLYGVMAFSVARRTREFGIRIALGAERLLLVRMVAREVALLVALGIVAGLPFALLMGRYVRSQLFGLSPQDPFTLAASAAVLLAAAMAAGCVPALRASRVDPLVALRYE
jgi:predicted permease